MTPFPVAVLLLVSGQVSAQPGTAEPQQLPRAAQVRSARAAAEADAAKAKGKRPYLGPLGLLWGMPIEDVKAALVDRLELVSEGPADEGVAFALRYRGQFAGMEAELVEADFHEGELFAVGVFLKEPDIRPAHRRWAEVVKEMRKSYGPPSSEGTMPESPAKRLRRAGQKDPRPPTALLQSASSDEADDAWLAAEIQTGRWAPKAIWDFPDAQVIVAVVQDGPDERGLRTSRVIWMFHDLKRYGLWSKTTEKLDLKNRDF